MICSLRRRQRSESELRLPAICSRLRRSAARDHNRLGKEKSPTVFKFVLAPNVLHLRPRERRSNRAHGTDCKTIDRSISVMTGLGVQRHSEREQKLYNYDRHRQLMGSRDLLVTCIRTATYSERMSQSHTWSPFRNLTMREKRGDDRTNGIITGSWSSRNRTQANVSFAARASSHHICTRHHDTGEWLAILEVDDGEVLEIGVGEER
jgi:hypothetical protein